MTDIPILALKEDILGDPHKHKNVRHSTMHTLQTNTMPKKIIPINSLNAYMHSWTIKAKIISKHDIYTFTNSKGVGQGCS